MSSTIACELRKLASPEGELKRNLDTIQGVMEQDKYDGTMRALLYLRNVQSGDFTYLKSLREQLLRDGYQRTDPLWRLVDKTVAIADQQGKL